jgi:type IV pilus assembly protein PilW
VLPISRTIRRYHTGFSLIEVMVGMVIGMLAIIVIMQVFSMFEGQKRTTTGAGSAQNTGVIALYGLQRDIQQAGYGTSQLNMIGCSVILTSAYTVSTFAPVVINSANIPAGDTNTDTLLISYGNTNGPTEGDGITAQPSSSVYAVQTPTSFSANDVVIAAPQTRPSTCSLAMDTVSGVSNPNITVATGVSGMAGGTLYNLGKSPTVRAYAVRSGKLTECNFLTSDCSDTTKTGDPTVWSPVASDVVSLRAQYGQDTNTPMDGIVDTYNQTAPTTACGWIKAPAIRLALVARNGQYNKNSVTTVAPSWLGSATTPIDLSGDANITATRCSRP